MHLDTSFASNSKHRTQDQGRGKCQCAVTSPTAFTLLWPSQRMFLGSHRCSAPLQHPDISMSVLGHLRDALILYMLHPPKCQMIPITWQPVSEMCCSLLLAVTVASLAMARTSHSVLLVQIAEKPSLLAGMAIQELGARNSNSPSHL